MKTLTTCILLALIAFLLLPLGAQERLVLSAPVYVDPGATEFRPGTLSLRRAMPGQDAYIVAGFWESVNGAFVPNGRTLECRYDGEEAEALIVALNKANLSTNSLEKRIIQRCQQDGKLGAGTVSGTPQ
jgi:hypothetical protein